MSHRFSLVLVLLSFSSQVFAEETVIHGAQAIRDGNLYSEAVHVDAADDESPSDVMQMLRLMPRLETLVIGGPRFMDHHLQDLAKQKSLRVLVLDSVEVSEKALKELEKARPELTVIRSQRWAAAAIGRLHNEIAVETRLRDSHPEIRRLIGDRYFHEVTEVDFHGLSNEYGPADPFLNEQLAPLRMLPTIKRLSVSWVRLNDGGMYYLKPLTKIEHLSIPMDEVSAEGLFHLRGMKHVKYFDGARVDDAGLKHLTGWQALEFFVIGRSSDMTDAGLESIGQMHKLQSLYLEAPRVQGTGLRHLATLPELQGLLLGPGVRDISALPELKSLKYLSMSATAVDDDALAPLAKCQKLESLRLDRTFIGDAGVMYLSGLARLQNLTLMETQVGDAGLIALQQIPQLTDLNLDRTRITKAGMATLQKFPALKTLSFLGMPLDEEWIQSLMQFKQLKSLTVGCPDHYRQTEQAQNEFYERLRKALPDCDIR